MASLMISALQEQQRYQAADAAEARLRWQQQQHRQQSSQRLDEHNEDVIPTESSPVVNRRRPTAVDGGTASGNERDGDEETEGEANNSGTSSGGSVSSRDAEGNNVSSTSLDTTTTRQPAIDQEMQDALSRWESHRRRQTFIQIVLFFFLLRLWMQALITGNGGLLLVCVILSIWFTKVQEQRRAEEQAMLESAGRGDSSTPSTTTGEGNSISSFFFRDDGDSSGMPPLRPFPFGGVGGGPVYTSDDLSFQMQLAIAMMESQRMMHEQMNNGMMPTTEQANEAQGVPSEVQHGWKRFKIIQSNGEDGNNDNQAYPSIQIIPVESSSQNSENESSSNSRPPLRTARETGARLSRFHRAFLARRRRRRQSHYASLDDSHDDSTDNRTSIHDLDLEEGALVVDDNNNENNNEQCPTPLAAECCGQTGDSTLQSKFLKVDDLTSCSICLGDYEPSETLVELPCGHVYHDDCVKAWVERSIKCPLCNFTLDGTADYDNDDK